MSIRDEMMSGRLYDASSGELLNELYRAQEMCQEYNALKITDFEGRKALLGKLIGKAGENLVVNPPFFCDYGSNIEMGDNVFINAYCVKRVRTYGFVDSVLFCQFFHDEKNHLPCKTSPATVEKNGVGEFGFGCDMQSCTFDVLEQDF